MNDFNAVRDMTPREKVTWYVDIDMTLPQPASQDDVDFYLDTIEQAHGVLAVGQAEPTLGLSFCVEAEHYFNAFMDAVSFVDAELMIPDYTVNSFRVLDAATRQKENEA